MDAPMSIGGACMAKTRPTQRMLPSDFTKWCKEQARLGDTPKNPKGEFGFFVLPENLLGKTDHGDRRFLVFYFDNEEDYGVVLDALGLPGKARSHPSLNSQALVDLIKGSRRAK